MASRFGVYGIAEGLVWHHALACMELPKAYGITEGAFFQRLDSMHSYGMIPFRLRRIPYGTPCRFHTRLWRDWDASKPRFSYPFNTIYYCAPPAGML